MSMSVVSETGQHSFEQKAQLDNNMSASFKFLLFNGTAKAKSFLLSLDFAEPPPHVQSSDGVDPPTGHVWTSFDSALVTIISKYTFFDALGPSNTTRASLTLLPFSQLWSLQGSPPCSAGGRGRIHGTHLGQSRGHARCTRCSARHAEIGPGSPLPLPPPLRLPQLRTVDAGRFFCSAWA
jgi:hypothetical protein